MELENLDLAKAITDLIAKQQEDLADHIEAQAIVDPKEPEGAPEQRAREAQSHMRFSDPGDYNEAQETEMRARMNQFNHYSEAGDPTYDPSGMYLCRTCIYRDGQDMDAVPPHCQIVAGDISLRTGSCDMYRYGDPSPWAHTEAADSSKVSKEKSGYQERPVTKGFGCLRCMYGNMAKYVDRAGRTMWCSKFGCHVQPLACCAANEGRDSIKNFKE